MNTANPDALVQRFWNELREIRTGMLGLVDARDAHSQPMTAHFEGTSGPLWFYTHAEAEIVAALVEHQRAVFHYAGPGHDLYACVHGRLAAIRDQQVIDKATTSRDGFRTGGPASR
jgi:general stress protein 26